MDWFEITKEPAKKIVIESAKDFNKFYDWKEVKEKDEARALPLIVLTSEGKGVVMRTEDLRDALRKKAENQKTPNNDSNGMTKNKSTNKSNSKRMAQVASVYEVARFIRKPETIIEEFFATKESKKESKKKIKRYQTKAKRVWARKGKIR